MPGANYMGGKRNAARARIRDSEKKVQRSHFGKKRFEVLRTGLNKGGAAQTSLARELQSGPSDISLAHARKSRDGSRDSFGLQSQQTNPYLFRRLSPIKLNLGCSKVLAALDADDPSVQRAQVQKILKMPDLLGLSRPPISQTPLYLDSQDAPCTPVKCVRERTSSAKVASRLPAMLSSPSSGSLERIIMSSAEKSSFADSTFVPMALDSSPMVDDHSGYAEFKSDIEFEYQPARVPFYVSSRSPFVYSSSNSSVSWSESPQARTISTTSSFMSNPRLATSTLSATSPSSPKPSPSHLDLPSPLAAAQFISDMPNPEPVSEPLELSPMPSSDISGCPWPRLASCAGDSYDVPQASSSLSSNITESGDTFDCILSEENVCEDKLSCRSSACSLLGTSQEDKCQETGPPDDENRWETVYLGDFLGDLFEDADPWTELGRILGLSITRVESTGIGNLEDTLALLGARGRRGVGYYTPEFWSSHNSPTRSCLVDDTNPGRGSCRVTSDTSITENPSSPCTDCGSSSLSVSLHAVSNPGSESGEVEMQVVLLGSLDSCQAHGQVEVQHVSGERELGVSNSSSSTYGDDAQTILDGPSLFCDEDGACSDEH